MNTVCTDNAEVNKAAWKIVHKNFEDAGKSILFYGCSAHVLNLLSKDLLDLPSAAETFSKAKTVVKAIKHSHVLLAEFNQIQKNDEKGVKTSLKIPPKTRWGAAAQTLESMQINKHNLQKLTNSSKANKYMNDITRDTI